MAAPTQQVHGRVPVSVDSMKSSGGEVTVDHLVGLGSEIYQKAVQAGYSRDRPEDHPKIDKLLARLWEEHADFRKEFPLVMRWAVQSLDYSAKAFRFYLTKVHKPHWKTRELFLKGQSEYLVILHRTRNPGCTPRELENYRTSVVKKVLEEDKAFQDANTEAEALVKSRAEQRTARLRAALEATARAAAGH
jgi:hypothetical protein